MNGKIYLVYENDQVADDTICVPDLINGTIVIVTNYPQTIALKLVVNNSYYNATNKKELCYINKNTATKLGLNYNYDTISVYPIKHNSKTYISVK